MRGGLFAFAFVCLCLACTGQTNYSLELLDNGFYRIVPCLNCGFAPGSGTGTTYSAGNGLNLSAAGTFTISSVVFTNGGFSVNGTSVQNGGNITITTSNPGAGSNFLSVATAWPSLNTTVTNAQLIISNGVVVGATSRPEPANGTTLIYSNGVSASPGTNLDLRIFNGYVSGGFLIVSGVVLVATNAVTITDVGGGTNAISVDGATTNFSPQNSTSVLYITNGVVKGFN